MQVNKISATTRTDNGKGASRRLRAAGKLPAVTYGKGEPTREVVVDPEELVKVLTSALGINTLIQLDVDGQPVNAMIGDYQYHPLTRKLLHADFIQIKDGQKVDVEVPIRLTGKAKGVVMGGKLTEVFRDLPVRCEPSRIPVEIVHDITDLDLDGHLSAGELKVPEGVEILLSPKRTVAVIAEDRRAKAEEAAEAAAQKPGEGAPAAAAAPAGESK